MCMASLVIVLTQEGITKMLISLGGCAGWSGLLLFKCNKIRFPPGEANKVWHSLDALKQDIVDYFMTLLYYYTRKIKNLS